VLSAADGLARASGDEELYLEILDEFVRIYASADDALEVMMRTDDLENAKQLCLDIKGVGSSVGAAKLADVAGKLYEALSQGDERLYSELVERFNTSLREVMTETRKYLP